LDAYWSAIKVVLASPTILFLDFIGVYIGIVIGAIPGLGPVFALSLFLALTVGMDAINGITFLIAIYCGCVAGGSISSILLNIPGTTGSIATSFDGFPMSQKGKAGTALGAAFTASAIGGIVGPLALAIVGPRLGRLAVALGPAEYASLVLLAFAMVASASRSVASKGLLVAGFGLMLSFVGIDIITATARFAVGNLLLENGVPFISAVIGVFAFSQAIVFAVSGGTVSEGGHITDSVFAGVISVLKVPFKLLRSVIIGVAIGIMPGIGISVSGLLNHAVEKNLSNDPDSYGRGNVNGLIAAESGNNATATGSLATAFSLGIPGGSTDAILLGGLMMYGLSPGRSFFDTSESLFFPILIIAMLVAPLVLLSALSIVRYMVIVTRIPHYTLLPIIIMLSFLGSYSIRGQMFDVWIMVIVGSIAYFLRRANFPLANFAIAMVLGSMFEQNVSRALRISHGSLSIFVTRPIPLIVVIITLFVLLTAFVDVKGWWKALIKRLFPTLGGGSA